MPYFDVSVGVHVKKALEHHFLTKRMAKELYALGYSHTKPTKISMAKSTFFVLKEHKAHKNHYFSLIS